MAEDYAARPAPANPSFVGIANGSHRTGIEIANGGQHDRGENLTGNGRDTAAVRRI
jgi:hypothetical protein